MTGDEGGEGARSRPSVKQIVRMALLAIAGLAVLALILQNQDPVQTRFLGWSVEMPRFLLLAVVYGLGVATGWIVRRRGQR